MDKVSGYNIFSIRLCLVNNMNLAIKMSNDSLMTKIMTIKNARPGLSLSSSHNVCTESDKERLHQLNINNVNMYIV